MPNTTNRTMNTPTLSKCDRTPTKATCDRTPTPRTDEAWAAWQYAGSGISVHVGRELERELTAVTEQRDRLAEALIKCREDSICEQVRMEKCRYTKAADESQANIDRADKALQYLNQPNNA